MKINAAAFHHSEHLEEKDLLEEHAKCLFCGSNNRQLISFLQKKPDIQLLHCKDCHAASASRMPTEAALTRYYSTYYDTPESKSNDVTFDDSQRFGKHIVRTFANKVKNKDSFTILDFGGGDGLISLRTAEELLKLGINSVAISVIDYSENLVTSTDSKITIQKIKELSMITCQFNLVIASGIVEHLPEPAPILEDLTSKIAPDGFFYARSPFVVSFIKWFQPFGIKWDMTYPAHLHDLGQSFWEYYFTSVEKKKKFSILLSKPSIVETTIKHHFIRTIAAWTLKAPWYILGRNYGFVGGWEIFVQKRTL
jgi:transcription elongation factor Elf1